MVGFFSLIIILVAVLKKQVTGMYWASLLPLSQLLLQDKLMYCWPHHLSSWETGIRLHSLNYIVKFSPSSLNNDFFFFLNIMDSMFHNLLQSLDIYA